MPSAHLGQHCQPNSSSSLGPYQAAVCHHIFHLRSFSSLARLGIEPGTCWMPIMCLTIECSLHMGLSSADQRDLSPAHRADEVGGRVQIQSTRAESSGPERLVLQWVQQNFPVLPRAAQSNAVPFFWELQMRIWDSCYFLGEGGALFFFLPWAQSAISSCYGTGQSIF